MGPVSTRGFVKLWQGQDRIAALLPAVLFAISLVPLATVRPASRMWVGALAALVGLACALRGGQPASRAARVAGALALAAWGLSAVAFLDAGAELRAALQPGLAAPLARALAEAGAGAEVRPLALDPWRALLEWGHLAGLMALAIGVARGIRGGAQARTLATGLVAVGVLVALTAAAHRLAGAPGPVWVDDAGVSPGEPFFGPFVSPNHGAAASAALLPLAVALAWASVGRARAAAGAAALVLVGGLLMAHSRAGWLDAAAGLGTLLALAGGRRARLGLAAAALAGLLGAAALGPERVALWLTEQVTPETAEDIDKGYTDVLTGRGQVYAETVDLVRAAPWVGVGPGGFDDGHQFVKRERNYRTPIHAHQEVLQLAAEHGLPVAALWVASALALGAALLRGAGAGGPPERLWRAAFAGAVAAIAADAMVDFPLRIGALAVLTATAVGAAAGLLPASEPARARWGAVALAGLCLVAIGAPVRILDLEGNLRNDFAAAEEAEQRGDRLIQEAIAAEQTGGRDSPFRASLTVAAAEMYQEALRRQPVRWRTLLKLARLRGSTGDREGAFRALDVTTGVFPVLPWAWLDTARFRRRVGEDVAADEAWRLFLLSDLPEDSDEIDIDALVQEAMGEGPSLARAAAVPPDHTNRWIAAARLAEAKGEVFAAEILLRRAAEITPAAGVELGAALLRWDRPAEATAALEATPPTCRVQLLLGDALLSAARPADARAHYDAAIRLCEGRARRARLGVARARLAQNDPAAIEALEALVREDPGDARTTRALIEALEAAGRGAEAERWRKALRAARAERQGDAD